MTKPDSKYKFPIPRSIHPRTRKYIKDLIDKLSKEGILTDLDQGALYLLMECYETWVRATEILKDSLVIADTNSKGQQIHKPHPAISIQKDSALQLTRLFSQFGLTPASRSKMKGKGPAESGSPLDQFL